MLTIILGFGGAAMAAACVLSLTTRKQNSCHYLYTKHESGMLESNSEDR